MTQIINMTPHPIHIVDADGNLVKTYPKGDSLIRLSASTVAVGMIDGVPTSKTVFSDPVGLPDFSDGTWYIVSQLVKSALPERTDLLVPAEMVRDANGNILGCKSLGI